MIELQAEAAKGDGDEGNARLTPMVGKELAGILERRKIARQVKAGDTTTLAALIFHHNGNPTVEIRNDLRRSAVKKLDEAGVSRDVAGFFRGFRKHGQFACGKKKGLRLEYRKPLPLNGLIGCGGQI